MPDLHKGLIDAINSGNDVEAKHILAMMHKPEFNELAVGDFFVCAAENGNLEILRLLQKIWRESLDEFLQKRKEEDDLDDHEVINGELKHQMQGRDEYLADASMKAMSKGHYEAAEFMFQECGASSIDEILDEIFKQDLVDSMKACVKAGFDINHTTSYKKKTLLMRAAYFGAFRIVDYLISKGADTTRLDKMKRSACTWAKIALDDNDGNMVDEPEDSLSNFEMTVKLLEKATPIQYQL